MKTNPGKGLRPDMTMDAIMRQWPQTIRVLLHHRLLCVGCPISTFHTVSDACREHGVDEELLRADILRAIETTPED